MGSGFTFQLSHFVFLFKFLYSAAGFHKDFLAACVEGMALGAYLHAYFLFCRTRHELNAASAAYLALMIFRLNLFPHYCFTSLNTIIIP